MYIYITELDQLTLKLRTSLACVSSYTTIYGYYYCICILILHYFQTE
jgi:hypothetical protein